MPFVFRKDVGLDEKKTFGFNAYRNYAYIYSSGRKGSVG